MARYLREHGPGGVGAASFGEICILAPRNSWLGTARRELEAEGLRPALQMRRNRNGDHPAYAWLSGLLAALCDPRNTFEWVGVLREIFAVSDAAIAAALKGRRGFSWNAPESHPGPVGAALATLRPFVHRIDAAGEPLECFARDLAAACGLHARARVVDPSGGIAGALDRLLVDAAELGVAGAGPREWLAGLLRGIDEGSPIGRPEADAINLLTSHSAKGLEWPVVIPIGLWRALRERTDPGLRLVGNGSTSHPVYFDEASLPAGTRESRDRERRREQTRLLYVTLTRARHSLALPWGEGFSPVEKDSFLELWGVDLARLPEIRTVAIPPAQAAGPKAPALRPAVVDAGRFHRLPSRILPHRLAGHTDEERGARHEAAEENPKPGAGGPAIEYGLWWHETLEFLPWGAEDAALSRYSARCLAKAASLGFRTRADEEWRRWQGSDARRLLNDPRWVRSAEIGLLAPIPGGAWIDGVVDLVLHDAAAGEVWVVDWKTNQRLEDETDGKLLRRIGDAYAPQLGAYGDSLAAAFPDTRLRLWIYSTVAGQLQEVGRAVPAPNNFSTP
jgi:ATP-dependent exoDNAse (exonuclease V) beta subunit